MFLPFRWVAGNERGEKSYVAAILCCAARANLEGVASCSTTLSSCYGSSSPFRPPFLSSARSPSHPPRRILRRAISSYPPAFPLPPALVPPALLLPLSDSRTHRLSILYYMSGPKLLDARTTPLPPCPLLVPLSPAPPRSSFCPPFSYIRR